MLPSGIRSDLSSEDKEVKRQLAKCLPRVYSKLIKSYIHGPSGVKPFQPSEPSGEKSSRPYALGPPQSSVMKPSQEELQARVEFLVKKRRSTKRKVPAASENSHAARGKVPKLGASSSPSSTQEQGPPGQFGVRGRPQHPAAEVSNVIGQQLCSPHVVIAKSPPGRITEPPLDILPIYVDSIFTVGVPELTKFIT